MLQSSPYLAFGPYQTIIDGMHLLLSLGEAVIKLTGPPQAGKSALLRQLQRQLLEEGQLALLLAPPPISAQALHTQLRQHLELGTEQDLHQALHDHLMGRPTASQQLILLLDDADTLDDDTLLATWRLRDITDNGRSLLSLVLCGAPPLNARLTAPAYDALVQRLSLSYALEPLSLRQLREFVPGAMAALDLQPPLPDTAELAQLHATTAGYPAAVVEALQRRIAPPPREPRLAAEPTPPELPRLRPVRQRDTASKSPLMPLLAMLFGGLLLAASAYGFWLDTQPVANSGDSAVSSTPAATAATPRTTQPPARPATIPIAPGAPLAPLARAPLTQPPVPDTPPAELPAQPQGYLPTQAELQTLVNDWLDAWQRGDPNAYFGHYHTDFAPLYQGSREQWRNQATTMLARPRPSGLMHETLDITAIDRIGVHVQFWMEYRLGEVAERVLKELYVGRDLDGQVRLLLEFERERGFATTP